MANHDKYSNSEGESERTKMVTRIWGMTIPIFALTIPLVAMTGSEAMALPVMAMLGATATSITIWLSKGSKKGYAELSDEQEQELRLMRRSIVELSEQVTYLEQRLEEQSLDKQIRQANPQANVQAASQAAPQAALPPNGQTFSQAPQPVPPQQQGSEPRGGQSYLQ
jgi:hypothetical protein